MPCEQPLRILNPRYKGLSDVELGREGRELFGTPRPPDLYIDVPCGWCFSCQKKRLGGYNLRLKFEHCKYPDSTYFVTLTFDQPSLKRFKNDTNKAVRLFLDRYRKKCGVSVRHFFMSEYGEKKGRLHYHGFLFNAPIHEDKDIAELWKYGRIDIQKCDINGTNYVTKYATKGTDCNKVQPRVITSKGIGDNFLTRERIAIQKNNGDYLPYIKTNGVLVPLPRYYLTKIFTDSERLEITKKRLLYEPYDMYLNGVHYDNEEDYKDALKGFLYEQIQRGLTPTTKPPTRKSKRKQSKLFTTVNTKFYGKNSYSVGLQTKD